jgi:hypothetical protein
VFGLVGADRQPDGLRLEGHRRDGHRLYAFAELDFGVVDGSDRSDDGQPQPEAARFPGARVVGAIEAVEKPRRCGIADARPLIDDVDLDPYAIKADSQLHGCALRTVAEDSDAQIG